jgi:hypothetical protein
MSHFKLVTITFLFSFLAFVGMVLYVALAPNEWPPTTEQGAGFCAFLILVSMLMMAVCGYCYGGYLFWWVTKRLEEKEGVSLQGRPCEVVDCEGVSVKRIEIADGSGGRWLCSKCASTPDPRMKLRFENESP